MMIRAVGFDLGNTLIKYWKPMNWQTHYAQAFAEVCRACGVAAAPEKIDAGKPDHE